MRSVLLFGTTLFASLSNAQYFGVTAGVEQASWNEIVAGYNATDPAEFIGPGWFLGGLWAPEDSTIYFRLEVSWEHQVWEQTFEGKAESASGSERIRKGKMTRRLEIVRLAPRVVFPLGASVDLTAGVSLGFIVAARTDEYAYVQFHSTGSPSNPGGTSITPADTSYTSTEGLGPYAALEVGLEVRVWRKLSLAGSVGIYSTYAGVSGSEDRGPPICTRFGLSWRF